MDLTDILWRLVGAFYAYGGYMVIRAMSVTEAIDMAINAIEGRPEPQKAGMRRALLGGSAVLTGVGGVALFMMSVWALHIFIVNLAVQAVWLFWSRTAFPPQTADDVLGRSRTMRAARIYAVMLIGVIWLYSKDRLLGAADLTASGVVAVSAIAYTGYLLHNFRVARSAAATQQGRGQPHYAPDEDVVQPGRVRMELSADLLPLVDADDGRRLSHFRYLPDDLASRVEAWHDRYVALAMAAPPEAATVFPSEDEQRAFDEEGAAIVRELEAIYGEGNVEGPVYLPRAPAAD